MEKKEIDDFVWVEYTERYYLNEMDETEADGNHYLIKDSYVGEDGKIIFKDKIHPNCALFCRDAERLKIKSAYECGCSCGYHLYNIQKLFPKVSVAGCDLLSTQVYTAAHRLKIPSFITDNIKIMDFSIEDAHKKVGKKYEYVFTNAVIMHLAHDKAVRFIRNMAEISSKYIRLSENCPNIEDMIEDSGLLDRYEREGDFLFRKIQDGL